MIDLEQSLEDLARRIDVPVNEWLVDDVLRRITAGTQSHDRRRRVAQLAAVAAAAVVVLLLVLPGPRRAVA
ncbi:MAG TPA: hypothetical protein VIH06_06150, partial [Ilumatobacteraceae bacterium]